MREFHFRQMMKVCVLHEREVVVYVSVSASSVQEGDRELCTSSVCVYKSHVYIHHIIFLIIRLFTLTPQVGY